MGGSQSDMAKVYEVPLMPSLLTGAIHGVADVALMKDHHLNVKELKIAGVSAVSDYAARQIYAYWGQPNQLFDPAKVSSMTAIPLVSGLVDTGVNMALGMRERSFYHFLIQVGSSAIVQSSGWAKPKDADSTKTYV